MDDLLLLSGAVSFIALIIFFFMANNVSRIRKAITEQQIIAAKVEYHRCLIKDDNVKATDALLTLFLFDMLRPDTAYEGRERYDYLRKSYTKHFEALGAEFPPYKG